MQKTLFLSLFFPTVAAVAADHTIKCGDHWFSVETSWTEGKTVGKSFFRGDSGPDRPEIKSTITQENKLIRVKFDDKIGGELRIENGDGYIKESRNSDEQAISPCRVD